MNSGSAEWLLCRPRLASFESFPRDDLKNVLLIVIDTLRRDHVGAYRSSLSSTEALDRLAGQSAVFENAFSAVPITQPSHLTMLTGRYPEQTGVTNNNMIPSSELVTLQNILKGYGYRTGAVVSIYALKESWGLGPGFDFYRDITQCPRSQMPELAVDWVRSDAGSPFFLLVNFDHPHSPRTPPGDARLLRLTLNRKDSIDLAVSDYDEKRIPLFLEPGRNVLHFEALPDRTLPSELLQYDQRKYDLAYAGMQKPKVLCGGKEMEISYGPEWNGFIFSDTGSIIIRNPSGKRKLAQLRFSAYRVMSPEVNNFRYARAVEEADDSVSRLIQELERLGCLEKTLVILTADHGEGLYRHGVSGHIQGVYAEQTRIPLLVKGPGVVSGRFYKWVSLADLAPTVLELLGLDFSLEGSGTAFAGILTGEEPDEKGGFAYSASYPPQSHVLRQAYRTPGWSYIREGKKERLIPFDPNNLDWNEEESPTGSHPEALQQIRKELEQFIRSLQQVSRDAVYSDLTEQEKEKLRALGYLR